MSFYAFKGFEHDLSCRGFQYEIGKTYVFDGDPFKCVQGFHYCTSLKDVFIYYPRARHAYITPASTWYDSQLNLYNKPAQRIFSSNRYCIVEVLGDVDGQTSLLTDTKGATNKIRIVKELSQDEIDDILYNYKVCNRYNGQLWNTYLLEFKEEVSDGKR